MPQPFRSGRVRKTIGRKVTPPERRGGPRERGYDARWDRISAAHRRRNPFCAECERKGRLTFVDVVDHKIPVADGGPIHDPANHWSLCRGCHAGVKADLERIAHASGQVHRLIEWCDRPETRPQIRGEIR